MLATKDLVQNYMLVNNIGENFSVCCRKVFSFAVPMLVKDVGENLCWWNMYVGEKFHQNAAFTHIFMQILWPEMCDFNYSK